MNSALVDPNWGDDARDARLSCYYYFVLFAPLLLLFILEGFFFVFKLFCKNISQNRKRRTVAGQ